MSVFPIFNVIMTVFKKGDGNFDVIVKFLLVPKIEFNSFAKR